MAMALPTLVLFLMPPAQPPVPGVTYLPMMPGSHGKPGLVTLQRSNLTVAFSDWRLRRSTVRCLSPELQNRDTDSPMISDSSGVPVLQFGTTTQDGGRSFGPVLSLPDRGKDCYVLDFYGTFPPDSPMYAPRNPGLIEKASPCRAGQMPGQRGRRHDWR
eukprot:SAG31_NODE_17_length_35773_cov_25.999271_2_plen_159_part_00